MLVGTIAVGIAEETLTRGLVLTALRGGMGEVGAWFWSSLLFGLLHGANIVLGQDVGPTLQQIVFAFVFGSVLYAARRSTGTLLVPIVLHAPCGTLRSWGAMVTSQPRRDCRASSPTRP
ncbi:MAG: lysostaphin resistance A-like protein [Actinomycetota bacterium]